MCHGRSPPCDTGCLAPPRAVCQYARAAIDLTNEHRQINNTVQLGDSYDIVKRFFCEALRGLGYTVYIDPMFSGEWSGQETAFYRFLGVERFTSASSASSSALFLDPDTGVNKKGSLSHVSYERVVGEAQKHKIVFAFDQSFSRGKAPEPQMREKIETIATLGCSAIYYDSHARFLFVSRARSDLHSLRNDLLSQGLPSSRFIEASPSGTVEWDARKSGTRPHRER